MLCKYTLYRIVLYVHFLIKDCWSSADAIEPIVGLIFTTYIKPGDVADAIEPIVGLIFTTYIKSGDVADAYDIIQHSGSMSRARA